MTLDVQAGPNEISDEDFATLFYETDLEDAMARCDVSRPHMLAAKAIAQGAWAPPSQEVLRRWLAIRPCMPEASFISTLLEWMLTHAASRATANEARGLAERVAALHRTGQDAHDVGEWRSVRRAAMNVADLETSNHQNKTVAELAAAAAWPPALASTVLSDSILQWSTLEAGQALKDAGIAPLDRRALERRLDALHAAALASGTPDGEIRVFELLEEQFPEEAKAFQEHRTADRLARASAMTVFVGEAKRIAGQGSPEP